MLKVLHCQTMFLVCLLSHVNLKRNKILSYLHFNGVLATQANLIITLSLGSIETDHVISEPCYNEVTLYRHIVK